MFHFISEFLQYQEGKDDESEVVEGKNEEEPKDEVETKIEETLSDDNKQKEAQHVSLPTPRLTHTHTHTQRIDKHN